MGELLFIPNDSEELSVLLFASWSEAMFRIMYGRSTLYEEAAAIS